MLSYDSFFLQKYTFWGIISIAKLSILVCELYSTDLIRRTPDLTADIGKNARELVCFKLLETFSVEGNQNNNENASALHQKIEFDPSDSCEDVLGHMLQEVFYFHYIRYWTFFYSY